MAQTAGSRDHQSDLGSITERASLDVTSPWDSIWHFTLMTEVTISQRHRSRYSKGGALMSYLHSAHLEG